MTIQRFEDIIVWQKTRDVSLAIYRALEENRDWSFRDQMCRCAVSIMNNIAEGFERSADRQFRHFLSISKGSAGELRSMLYLAKELGYLTEPQFQTLFRNTTDISKMLGSLIKSIDKNF